MSTKNIYHVRWLDFRYLQDFSHLNFQYLTYEVTADNEEEAIERARKSYMKGEKEKFSEELPFLLKLHSATLKRIKAKKNKRNKTVKRCI